MESSTLLPDNKVDEWNHQLWVKHNGISVLSDEEWERLSADDKASYRRLNYIEVRLSSRLKVYPGIESVCVTEEAVTTLAEMLVTDVLIGDPINRRYQHECKYNEDFASRFGFALDMALEELYDDEQDEGMRRQMVRAMMNACAHSGEIRPMIISCGHIDDNGDNVTEPTSEPKSVIDKNNPANN